MHSQDAYFVYKIDAGDLSKQSPQVRFGNDFG